MHGKRKKENVYDYNGPMSWEVVSKNVKYGMDDQRMLPPAIVSSFIFILEEHSEISAAFIFLQYRFNDQIPFC